MDLSNAVSLAWSNSVANVDSKFYTGSSVTKANKSIRQLLKGLFGVVVGPNVEVGISCNPLAAHQTW